jgi:hypothetical protein
MLGLMQKLLLAFALSGCALMPFPAATPKAIQPGDKTVPHSLEYEVLAQATGKACASLASLAILHGPRFVDTMTVGHPALFERAKYEAIASTKGADGLAGVSAKVELNGGDECVTVIGRAFAIRAIYDIAPSLEKATADENERKRRDAPIAPEE